MKNSGPEHTIEQQRRFAELAGSSTDSDERRRAIGKVSDPSIITELLSREPALIDFISDTETLVRLACSYINDDVRNAVIRKIPDEDLRKQAEHIGPALDNYKWPSNRNAVYEIKDEQMLFFIAANAGIPPVRQAAAARLRNQAMLLSIVKHDGDRDVAASAFRAISDPNALLEIVKDDKIWTSIRESALSKLKEMMKNTQG